MDDIQAQSSPTITLTTPTPAFPQSSTLASPPPPPAQEENFSTMNEYTNSPGPEGDVDADTTGALDMEVLHDFGEGVGVDMRDFGHTKEDSGENELSTPQLQHRPITPQPQMSLPSSGSGIHPNPVNVDDMFQAETGMDGGEDDDEEDEEGAGPKKRNKFQDVPGGFTFVDKDGENGRRKIRIEYIGDKSRRHITFSKRKAGIMKKAYELSILTGTQVLLLVVSETGLVYTFTTTKLQPLVQKSEGKNLIQACLNAPDGFGPDGQPLSVGVIPTKAKNGGLAIRPHKLTAAASAAMAASAQQAAASNHMPDGMSTLNDHQGSAADAVGHGTPMSARPRKRLPSGKQRKGGSGNNSGADMPNQPSDLPPVPAIPEMHRQPSPHNLGMALQSPMSASASYPYPSSHHPGDYHNLHHSQQHQQHHQTPHHLSSAGPSPTQSSFGYPPGEYAYYPSSSSGQSQQPGGNGYLGIGGQSGLQSPYGHAGHPSQGHSPGGSTQREEDRRILSMGM